MVRRLTYPIILLLLLFPAAIQAAAGETLTVEPDRTRLYEGEVLTLTVKGSTKIDINLQNLFDFDLSDLPAPDIEKVEPEFKILARNQRYSIRTVNNEMVGEITWTFQLAPTKTGTLTIPSLTFKGAQSEPVTIEVASGSAPQEPSSEPQDSFIELSADKNEVYIQEQLVLTIRLFFTGNLIRGELSEPEHPHAIVESLGKQKEYTRYRDGTRYRVVERRYAIFPQKEGELTLRPIRFEGQARDANGQLKFLRDSEQLFAIPVNGIPAGFSGDIWLPATSLELSESGLPQGPSVEVGENLTRTLELKANALPSEALPPFPQQDLAGIRAYPETPERNTRTQEQGLSSVLSQTTALVPVQSGTLVLPEIRIPWWDTTSDREKMAVIPARTLTVRADPNESGLAPTSPSQDSSPDDPGTGSSDPDQEQASTGTPWRWLSLVLGIGWMITLIALLVWWYRHRRSRPSSTASQPDPGEKALFEALCQAAKSGTPETFELLPRWMGYRFPEQRFNGLNDIARFSGDEILARELGKLQRRLFGRVPNQNDQGEEWDKPWDGEALVNGLKELRERRPEDEEPHQTLPPLYPDILAAR